MKVIRILMLLGTVALLGACVQTTVYKAVIETRHPDGSKTVVVERSVRQFYAASKTEGTADAVKTTNSVR